MPTFGERNPMLRQRLLFSVALTVVVASASGGAQQGLSLKLLVPLIITSASYDAVNHQLTIHGLNFGRRPPSVSIEQQPLTILTSTPQLVVAALPPSLAPGTYLLTLTR